MGNLTSSALKLWNHLIRWSKKVRMPFLEGMSLFAVTQFFGTALYKGSITTRASSTAFSFFLALFPFTIFLFTLIPYITINGFREEVFQLLHDVLPPYSYEAAKETIEDVISNKRGGLLSFGFIAALVFATNGTNTLMNNLGLSINQIETRGFWKQYLASLVLTVSLSVLFLAGITLMVFSQGVTRFLVEHEVMSQVVADYLSNSRWIILVVLILVAISMLYYYGPTKRREWRFLSPGAVMATTLFVLTSVAFGYYVENFATYNKLYGSIGTLMIILLWIYLNAIVLILGYEFNTSIAAARYKSKTTNP